MCLSPGGKLTLSLDKEVFQSVRLEGKPVQSSRKIVDKYRKFEKEQLNFWDLIS